MTAPDALAAGDPAAWREAVAEYGPMLARIAHLDFRLSAEDAADAAQETWASLLRHAGRIDPAGLRGWLAVVMRNACLTRIRRERRYRPCSDAPEVFEREPAADFADDVTGALDALGAPRIADLAEALPRQQRRAVAARMEGESMEEIAAELGVAVNTVKGHLHRARAALRKALERPEETGPARAAGELVTVHQAAGLLGVPAGTVRELAEAGALPAGRSGDGRVLLALDGVLEMRRSRARNARRDAAARAAQARAAARRARSADPLTLPARRRIPEFITTGQAARLARTSADQVAKEADRGDLPCERPGGRFRRFARADVEAWLIRRAAHRPVSPEMLAYEQRRAEFIAWLEAQLPREDGEAA